MKKPAQIFSALQPATAKNKYNNNLGGPVWVIPLTILIFGASQLAAGVIIGLGLALAKHTSDIGSFFDEAWVQFAYVLLAEAAAIGLVFWVLKLKKTPRGAIGLGRRPTWNDAWSGLLGFGVYYLLLIVVMALAAQLIPSLDLDQSQDVGFNQINDGLDKLFAFSSLVLLAPIGEEVLMRGYLYSGLREKLKYLPSLLITSAIFSIAHLEFGSGGPLVWAAALATFVLSAVLVYKREKTGAIYAGILIHMLNNTVAFLVNF